MHGFLRMYWAKKILEWTESPEQALEYAILLNDKYNLDGTDPNGYVGKLHVVNWWHHMIKVGLKEIFWKNSLYELSGLQTQFDVNAFVARYGGKVHTKK
ncbi:Deoxyribodipyrimidine photo-lyase [Eumeta japonica]|uniref:Deoxyribodipyrimidine photo-lyase n=1 Tax=Eumeta variegata TaxID=151549 RepID=A0A4C1T3D8_EUMVA|nr:Deoxyribodipyrimidine photo-lyase [Eumeta japonica]